MRAGFAVALMSMMLIVTACTNEGSPPRSPSTEGSALDRSVVVRRGTLESIVVVPGRVVANPTFPLSVDAAGTLTRTRGLGNGVEAGQALGEIGEKSITAEHQVHIQKWLVEEGQYVVAHSPVVLVQYSGFGISATVPPDQLHRIYASPASARANVESGPGGVNCSLVPGRILEEADGESSAGNNLPVLCLLPPDADVVDGLPAQVGLAAGRVEDALLLPMSAVLGSAQRGQVALLDAQGDPSTVEVELGISDGVNIQIVSGLEEGDRVASRAPKLVP